MYRYLIILVLVLPLQSFGQLLSDAIRYSEMQYLGTARHIGVGSAMGPLGADYGAIVNNPAGLGVFRRSEITVSPSLIFTDNTSWLELDPENPTDANATQFNIMNFGAVIALNPESKTFSKLNLGFGFNSRGNYSRNIEVVGASLGSMAQRFVELSNGIAPESLDAFEAGPAYDAYVTFVDDYLNYGADVGSSDFLVKNQKIEEKGSTNELNFSIGANVKEKLMVGLTLAVPFVKFTQVKNYREDNTREDIFKSMLFDESLDATGVGFNAKIGLIYRPVYAVSISAAYHTPSWYSINENFNTSVTYDYTYIEDIFPGPGPQVANSPFGSFDYNLHTPARITTGLGIIIKRSGFLTFEAEYVDYQNTKFRMKAQNSDLQDFENELNNEIKNNLQSVWNLRVGGEWAIKRFRIRAGYEHLPHVLLQGRSFPTYSGGIGYRANEFFIDLAYRHRKTESDYVLYGLSNGDSPNVFSDQVNQFVVATVGFKL